MALLKHRYKALWETRRKFQKNLVNYYLNPFPFFVVIARGGC